MDERLNPELLKTVAGEIPQLYADGEFAILNEMLLAAPAMSCLAGTTPMLVEAGRVMLVTRGDASMNVNMMPYEVSAGTAMVLPENSYIEVRTLSDDYNARLVSFSHLGTTIDGCLLLHPGEKDFRRLMAYVDLMWNLVHSPNYATDTRDALLTALLSDLRHLASAAGGSTSPAGSLTARFLTLLNSDAITSRNVSAYAERLCVTPGHLSAVVRRQSGQTVMQLVNARLVLRAKVMLAGGSLTVFEIADSLHFADTAAFSRFFHREAGLTPTQYRRLLNTSF